MPNNFQVISARDGTREIRDMDKQSGHSRHANYKNRNSGSKYVRNNNVKRLLDEDVEMGGVNNFSRTNGRNGRKGGHNNNNNRVHRDPETKWYRAEIRMSKEVEKQVLLNAIASNVSGPFHPYNYRSAGKTVSFHVCDSREFRMLRDISGKITLPDGQKLIIKMSNSGRPYSELNERAFNVIKEVMGKRFEASTNHLDLSNFTEDSDLMQNDVFVSITNRRLIDAILKIIEENIPQLKSLDLSNNKLENLKTFAQIATKAPKLTSVVLVDNRLRHMIDLDPLKSLKLEEISLRGNVILLKPLQDGQAYIRKMRSIFPLLLKLDQEVLPPPITFEVENTDLLKIPDSLGSHFGQENVQGVVCLFLQQYFGIYDTKDKSPLINAYHENATYSLTCCHHTKLSDKHQNMPGAGLSKYFSVSRNISKISYDEANARLKSNRTEIIKLINNLPLTLHDPDSFVVDVSHISPLMIVFNVKGIFKEVSSKTSSSHPTVRQFNRIIVAVPNGPGLAIINEMVNIFNLSPEQYEKYLEAQKAKPVVVQPVIATASTSPQQLMTPQQQNEMVAMFSQQSGMNTHFSALCLSENEWNYEKAAAKFTELQAMGGIPAEAFVK